MCENAEQILKKTAEVVIVRFTYLAIGYISFHQRRLEGEKV